MVGGAPAGPPARGSGVDAAREHGVGGPLHEELPPAGPDPCGAGAGPVIARGAEASRRGLKEGAVRKHEGGPVQSARPFVSPSIAWRFAWRYSADLTSTTRTN